MLASHLTPMLTSGQLVENSIVKVTNHVASIVKNPEKGDKYVFLVIIFFYHDDVVSFSIKMLNIFIIDELW